MEQPERHSFGRPFRDIIVIGGLLAAINWLASREDFGWFDYNPTPWLLLPLLIGLRHGVPPGLISGVLAGAGIAFMHGEQDKELLRAFIQDHPYYFTALIFTGLMAGEVHRGLRRQNTQLQSQSRVDAEELQSARAELELGRETRQQLQQCLALHNASLACIDDDLRKLIAGPPEDLMERLMGLLHQHGQITSAAIYRRRGDALHRLAALHPTGPLRPDLHLDQVPIARRALNERALVSVKAPMETSAAQPFLAALPFEDTEGEGVLLVQDMPLSSFDWAHFARLEMILLWTSSLLIARARATEENRLVALPVFQQLLGQALATESAHHVPSVAMKVQGITTDVMRKTLLRLLPVIATATPLPQINGLAVLLPFGGESDAMALAREFQKLDPAIRIANYLVGGGARVDEFWAHFAKP